jgi:peptide/nickel transport system permease protein
MLKFIIKRTISGAVALVLFTFLMFVLIEVLLPGDYATPFRLTMTADEIAAFREALGLDRPIPVRYWFWLRNLVTSGLGQETFRIAGGLQLKNVIPSTVLVFVTGLGAAYLLGSWLGRVTGWRSGWKSDGVTFLGIATYTLFPPFLGFLMVRYLGNPMFDLRNALIDDPRGNLWLGAPVSVQDVIWTMVATLLVVATLYVALGSWVARRRNWRMLSLPAFVIVGAVSYGWWIYRSINLFALDILFDASLAILAFLLLSYGEFMLVMQTSMSTVIHDDYIQVARAKGIPDRQIRDRHAARNALLPLLSRFAVSLPYLLTGLVIIERAVGWHGVGSFLFQAVDGQDMPVIMDALVVIGAITLVVRLVMEVLTAVLDPRIRVQAESGVR